MILGVSHSQFYCSDRTDYNRHNVYRYNTILCSLQTDHWRGNHTLDCVDMLSCRPLAQALDYDCLNVYMYHIRTYICILLNLVQCLWPKVIKTTHVTNSIFSTFSRRCGSKDRRAGHRPLKLKIIIIRFFLGGGFA